MASGIPIGALPYQLSPQLVPCLDPCLVEVIVPFSTGTVDEAVRQASLLVEAAVSAAIAQLTAGSPTELDTFIEVYNRFLGDESAAAALTALVATKAAAARKVSAAGLATGGGDLTADRTITVPKAGAADVLAGTDDTKAVTPFSLKGALDAKAPLNSPVLTGAPTAPTAALGTNTTQLATTAFVVAALGDLIGTAPAALDTLYELAAQLQADETTAATLANLVGTKAASARQIAVSGLAQGGGDLTADRTVTVPKATSDQAKAAADDTVALTPASGLTLVKAQAVAILKAARAVLPTSNAGLASGEPYLNGTMIDFVP